MPVSPLKVMVPKFEPLLLRTLASPPALKTIEPTPEAWLISRSALSSPLKTIAPTVPELASVSAPPSPEKLLAPLAVRAPLKRMDLAEPVLITCLAPTTVPAGRLPSPLKTMSPVTVPGFRSVSVSAPPLNVIEPTVPATRTPLTVAPFSRRSAPPSPLKTIVPETTPGFRSVSESDPPV